MAKGSYNISVSGHSNLGKGRDKHNESEFENQECMNSCLSPVFLRSLSFHDRPRSSRVPTNKGFRCTGYKSLVSSSLEKIPSNLLLPSERKSESSTYHRSESIGVDSETQVTTQSSNFNATPFVIDQNQLSGVDNISEDRNTRFGVESGNLLEKTIDILSAVDKDISESFTNLTRPESIALESVIEIYKNKSKSATGCSVISEFDLSTETSSQAVNENKMPSVQKRPKDVQPHSTPRRSKEYFRQSPKDLQVQSPRQSPKDLQVQSPRQSPKDLQVQSPRQSPKDLQVQLPRESPKDLQVQLPRESPENLRAQCSRQRLKETLYFQQIPKNVESHSAQQSPKRLLVQPVHQTLTNLQSQSSNLENTRFLTKPDSNNLPSIKQSTKNLSSPKRNAPHGSTELKSPIEFDLPSDHEQFVKIIEALQNRCLEYREMTQDIAVSALEECLSFSEFSVNRIWHLRKQFESQKKNFRDFKELCCKSVVFGPDSLPIDEKVTEVIQSFYLKLLQEENETFIARLEFGLKMSEVYAKILKYETESKKIITTLEKEVLYLKKTSVGFKV